MQDKNEISEFGGGEPKKEQNLDFRTLVSAYAALFIALACFCLKFTSRIKFITLAAKSAI